MHHLQGNAERQVLVKDYEVGKTVAFDQRVPNLKEVYTTDGYKMYVDMEPVLIRLFFATNYFNN